MAKSHKSEAARSDAGPDLKAMSSAELWNLLLEVRRILPVKLAEEQKRLDGMLGQIGPLTAGSVRQLGSSRKDGTARRPYPPVLPKYRNPKNRAETWSGRGKQPRWLVAEIKAGRKADDFLIKRGRPVHRDGRRPLRHA